MSMFPRPHVPGARPAGWKAKGIRCNCRCHRMPSVKHIVACCQSTEPEAKPKVTP
jgi:hypothetical protein